MKKCILVAVSLVAWLVTTGANFSGSAWPAGTTVQVNGELAAEAVAAWNGVGFNLPLEVGGAVSCGEFNRPVITICEGPVAGDSAGYATTQTNSAGEIIGCSITLESLTPELAVHEVGHCLGLDHTGVAGDCMAPTPPGGCVLIHSGAELRSAYGANAPPSQPPPPRTFSDTAGDAHEANIDCIARLGIAQGYGDGTFGPGDPVTRGQMASFLARTLDAAAAGATC